MKLYMIRGKNGLCRGPPLKKTWTAIGPHQTRAVFHALLIRNFNEVRAPFVDSPPTTLHGNSGDLHVINRPSKWTPPDKAPHDP